MRIAYVTRYLVDSASSVVERRERASLCGCNLAFTGCVEAGWYSDPRDGLDRYAPPTRSNVPPASQRNQKHQSAGALPDRKSLRLRGLLLKHRIIFFRGATKAEGSVLRILSIVFFDVCICRSKNP